MGAPACSRATVMCLNWQNTHQAVSFLEKHFIAHKLNIPPHTFLLSACLANHVGLLQIGHISTINIYSPRVSR